MPSRKSEIFPTSKNPKNSKERTDLNVIQYQAFLIQAEFSDKEWIANCHHMLHQDGIGRQSSSSPREFTALNQTCGALAVYSESAFHSPMITVDKDSENLRKELCSQVQAASQFLHAALLMPTARSQPSYTRKTSSSRSSSKWVQNQSKTFLSSQMRLLLNTLDSSATDPSQALSNKSSNTLLKKWLKCSKVFLNSIINSDYLPKSAWNIKCLMISEWKDLKSEPLTKSNFNATALTNMTTYKKQTHSATTSTTTRASLSQRYNKYEQKTLNNVQ